MQKLLWDLDQDHHLKVNKIIRFKMRIMKNQNQNFKFKLIYHDILFKIINEPLHRKEEQIHKNRK